PSSLPVAEPVQPASEWTAATVSQDSPPGCAPTDSILPIVGWRGADPAQSGQRLPAVPAPSTGRMTRRHSPDLRSLAQAQIAHGPQESLAPGALSIELDIHQVELGIQNEELRATRSEVEAALARSTEVFDFAPIGYAVLGAGGEIREINHAGAA